MSRSEEVDISGLINRLEEIAETLEDGDIELDHAKGLREEADKHLETLRETLDVGDGDIVEIEDARSDDTAE